MPSTSPPTAEPRRGTAPLPAGSGLTRASLRAWPPVAPLVALLIGALTLRLLFIGEQSAFMDEATYILTGRLLIEQGAVYARALDWTFGSYLWPLIAGASDIVGGLTLVRAVTAGLGVAMVLATTFAAAQLAPRAAGAPSPWLVALLAGLIMAVLPAPVAVGPFGTYDGLSMAAFMGGVALLLGARRTGRRRAFLAAAGLLFVGFLAKYLVAIYFPFVCLYLMLSARRWSVLARNLAWFVVPLSAACLGYFLLFRAELINLVTYAAGLNRQEVQEIASATPLNEYGWQRLDLWALASLALLGSRRIDPSGRLIVWGGAAVMFLFHLVTRADHDWWKHSIYAVFFLAPPAALALAPAVERLLAAAGDDEAGRSISRALVPATALGVLAPLAGGAIVASAPVLAARLGTGWAYGLSVVVAVAAVAVLLLAPLVEILAEERGYHVPSRAWRRLGLGLAAALLVPAALAFSLGQARRMVTFYPNLLNSLASIREHTARARLVLADDSVLRYYLYPRIAPDAVIGPFAVDYRGLQGLDGYRRLITDRYVDVIVLDGGIGPLGRRIREQLGPTIERYYERVYVGEPEAGATIEIYRAREEQLTPPDSRSHVYRFDAGPQGWGAHMEGADLIPGVSVVIDRERTWQGRPSLAFAVSDAASLVGVRRTGPVTKVRAQIYVVPTAAAGRAATDIYMGMVGFNADWQWRDDGFAQVVPPERWIEVEWELAEPGLYHEIGLKFDAATVATVYVGQVEVRP